MELANYIVDIMEEDRKSSYLKLQITHFNDVEELRFKRENNHFHWNYKKLFMKMPFDDEPAIENHMSKIIYKMLVNLSTKTKPMIPKDEEDIIRYCLSYKGEEIYDAGYIFAKILDIDEDAGRIWMDMIDPIYKMEFDW